MQPTYITTIYDKRANHSLVMFVRISYYTHIIMKQWSTLEASRMRMDIHWVKSSFTSFPLIFSLPNQHIKQTKNDKTTLTEKIISLSTEQHHAPYPHSYCHFKNYILGSILLVLHSRPEDGNCKVHWYVSTAWTYCDMITESWNNLTRKVIHF
jgi:hypothetical protein